MLISKSIIIKKPNGNSCSYYKNLGYNISLPQLEVNIDHLLKGSSYKVDVICDYCFLEKKITYKDYNKITNDGFDKYACSSCSKFKYKENCNSKYNVDNLFQLESVKSKIKETNLFKYGVEYHTKSLLTKDKIKKSVIEKYGVDNISKLDSTKEKVKKTNLLKFGSEYMSNSFKFRSNNKIDNDPNQVSYLGNSLHLFNCIKGHTFEINNDNYHSRIRCNIPLCTICNPIGENRSIKEKEIFELITNLCDYTVIKSYKDQFEIDIYLPDLKIGFEFNGVYWHSDKFLKKDYHLNKTNHFKNKGIQIFHIWEDDWNQKNDIILSMIKNKLNKTDNKIFARKCVIKEVNDIELIRNFLNNNHIQGYVNSTLKLGLYYNNELVSLMTFDHFEGRKKMTESEWNLCRFCTTLNTNVIGGASKLLNYFINNYNVDKVISYADRSWSNGDLYKKLKFSELYYTKEDYKYLIKDKRVHKSKFRKSKTGISESNNGIYKVYDCGKIKYELLLSKK